MIKNPECKHLNTTDYVPHRLAHTLKVSKTGLRLVMFQVWFMKNAATGTLKGYNERLGRPQSRVRNEIFAKSKFILSSDKWSDYFNELDIVMNSDKDLDQLLRFSIYRSKQMGYHYVNNGHLNPARQGRGGYQNDHYGNNPHQRPHHSVHAQRPRQYGYGNGYGFGGGMQRQPQFGNRMGMQHSMQQQRHYAMHHQQPSYNNRGVYGHGYGHQGNYQQQRYYNGGAQGHQQYGHGYRGGMQRPFSHQQPQMNPIRYGMQSRMHQNGMRPQQQQSFGIMDRRQPESRIHFMKPPVMKVKDARKTAKPSPPASKNMIRPVHHQASGKNHSAQMSEQQQPKQQEQNKNAEAVMKPAQTGYGSPVSSSASSPQQQQDQPGKDKAKLSKSQRAKMRKRLAKQRKKEAQKYFKV